VIGGGLVGTIVPAHDGEQSLPPVVAQKWPSISRRTFASWSEVSPPVAVGVPLETVKLRTDGIWLPDAHAQEQPAVVDPPQHWHPGINMPPPYVHWAAMRYHAVPSLAIAQLRGDVADVAMAAKMFTATAVLGVLVVVRNVTVLLALSDHAPVNVPMRIILGDDVPSAGLNVTGG
jgi:hypothetical protein